MSNPKPSSRWQQRRNPHWFNRLFSVMALSVLLLTLGTCSPRPKNLESKTAQWAGNTSQLTTDKTILELWTLQMQPFAPLMKTMIREFEEAHPWVSVHWVDVPFSEGKKRALTAILGGHPPDVINLNPDFSALLAQRGELLNLNQWLSKNQQAMYHPLAWQSVSLTVSPDNTLTFGLPWYLTTPVTVYRKSWLPHGPQFTTLTQLAHWCHHLQQTHANQYCLMPVLNENGAMRKWWLRAGLSPESTEAQAMLQQWALMYQQHLIPTESLTEGHRGSIDRYQSGTLGMIQTGANFLGMIAENAPQRYADSDVAPALFSNHHANSQLELSTMTLAIPKASRHRSLAIALALWLTQTPYQSELAHQVPVLPSTTLGLLQRQQELRHTPAPYTRNALEAKALTIGLDSILSGRYQHAIQIQPNQATLNQQTDEQTQLALLQKPS